MVKLLLKSGAQIEIKSKVILGYSTLCEVTIDDHVYKQDGRTPLMVAAWKGRLEIVMELLRAGAHANTQDQVCMDEVYDLYNHVVCCRRGSLHSC